MTNSGLKNLLWFLVLVVAGRVIMFAVTGFTADDAFITYRYAESVSEGRGFEYNPGETVQGTSTPLYTFILAGLSLVFGGHAIPAISRIIGVAADGVCLFLLMRTTASLGTAPQFIVAALFALFPRYVFISSLGMETPLVVMMMILSFVLWKSGNSALACAVLGLLVVLRIDGGVWSALLLALMVWKDRKVPASGALMLALICGGWLLYAQLTFGSIVPNAVLAKNVSWSHLFGGFEPVRVLLGYFPYHAMRDLPEAVKFALAALLVLPLFAVIPHLYRKRDPLLLFPVFFLLYNGMLAAARVVMADWYYLPGYAAYFVSIGCALAGFFGSPMTSTGGIPHAGAMKGASIAVLTFFLVLGMTRWERDPGYWFRDELVRMGTWLRENAHAGSSVLLEPIGYVGWASNLYIHDEVGLVSPRILEYRRRYEGSDAWFLHFVEDVRPTFVILQNQELSSNLLFLGHGDGIFRESREREWFFGHYAEAGNSPDSPSRGGHLYAIYELIDESRH